jgi:2-polyprenyl-3-methyl-5-hydroxy-6-metoxy-1,4-benzoquinol methylase
MFTSSHPTTTSPVCPLTGARMKRWLHVPCDWRRPELETGYDLYWSAPGRFGQLHPRPTADEVADSYEVDYYTHGGPPAPSRAKRFLERAREHLAWRADYGTELTASRFRGLATGRSSPSALEIGCGDGTLLADLRADGWTVAGIEPDPMARRAAEARGLEVHDGTAEDPPGAMLGRTFDAVVMHHVLEHCLDPLAALRSAAALMKPDWLLIVETPNNKAAGCRSAGASWPWLDVPRHLNFFTAHSLHLACAAAGLTISSTTYTGFTRQYQTPWIEMERRIRAAFNGKAVIPNLGRIAWSQLFRTAFADPRYKYDSVRVEARRSPASISQTAEVRTTRIGQASTRQTPC